MAWSPRADGLFLQDNPQRLVEQGKVMNVPFVSGKLRLHLTRLCLIIASGNVDDEGTLFSLSSLNITSVIYISSNQFSSSHAHFLQHRRRLSRIHIHRLGTSSQ